MLGQLFYRAASLSDFSGSIPLKRDVNGWPLILVQHEGMIQAFHNKCSHVHVKMHGPRVEDKVLICPYHGARFDLTTGHCVHNPLPGARVNLAPLRRFDTRQIDGWVEFAVPEKSPSR